MIEDADYRSDSGFVIHPAEGEGRLIKTTIPLKTLKDKAARDFYT
jgi:hypothetical protein